MIIFNFFQIWLFCFWYIGKWLTFVFYPYILEPCYNHMNSRRFLCQFFSLYRLPCYLETKTAFISFFSICIYFFLMHKLGVEFNAEYKKEQWQEGKFLLFHILEGKFECFTIKCNVSYSIFCWCSLWSYDSSLCLVYWDFNMLDFVKSFFFIYWLNHMVFFGSVWGNEL